MADRGLRLIRPDWPAPKRIRAVSTTRGGGVSVAPYDSLNLGLHVGDDTDRVVANRAALSTALDLSVKPGWLDQVHGTVVADFDAADPDRHRVPPTADAAISSRPERVCAIMTADCLPILLTDAAGTAVAAAHGGWRGLCAGVVESTVAAFRARGISPGGLLAWLGPAIGADAYEVGADVADALGPADADALRPGRAGHWQLDLYELARLRLNACGVDRIFGGDRCTLSETGRFFSYRRDGVTGRQATLIWLQQA